MNLQVGRSILMVRESFFLSSPPFVSFLFFFFILALFFLELVVDADSKPLDASFKHKLCV